MSQAVGFLFDLDGVLVDTHRIVIAGWQAFARERGREVSEREIVDRLFGRRTYDILIDFFDLDPAEAADLVASGIDDKRAEVGAGALLAPVAGAPDFVRATLAAGIASAVVSSASATNVRLALDAIGLGDAFEVIIDHGKVARGKPAPDPYLAGAAAIGLRASSCVVFEDTRPGLESGRAAGARCVGVATLAAPDALVLADLVIDDFLGLEPLELISRLDEHAPRRADRDARYRDTSTADG